MNTDWIVTKHMIKKYCIYHIRTVHSDIIKVLFIHQLMH